MIVYWSMFVASSLGALGEQSRAWLEKQRLTVPFLGMVLIIFIVIAFRWKTGGDWGNYNAGITVVYWQPLSQTLTGSDPAFGLVSYLAGRGFGGMLFVQVISGFAMAAALLRFCLYQPRPWLALSLAIPYLVIVVGMGYIRQAIAISFCMMAFVTLANGHVLRYLVWVAVGALFHSSAVLMMPIAVLSSSRNRVLNLILGGVIVALGYYFILAAKSDAFLLNYEDAGVNSSGAGVRLAMSALPSALFLLLRNRIELNSAERNFWTVMSVIGVGLLFALGFSNSSTAVDRVALYWLPLQLFVWSRLPDALSPLDNGRRLIVLAILSGYTATLYVWLVYADNARNWVNYTFYFFADKL